MADRSTSSINLKIFKTSQIVFILKKEWAQKGDEGTPISCIGGEQGIKAKFWAAENFGNWE